MIRMLCPTPDNFSKKGLDLASRKVDFTAKKISQIQFDEMAPDYESVLVRFNTNVSKQVMGKGGRLKYILSPTTGLDHIEMDYAESKGIKIYHLRGEKSFLKGVSATSEHTMCLMTALMRMLPAAFDSVKNGEWASERFQGNELCGKLLGIVGCGRLGSKVARIALAFGMRVIAYDPGVRRLPAKVEREPRLGALLKKVDVLSLHVPLTRETKHMIDSKKLRLMKKGSFLVNTSRGDIICSDALLKYLENGHLKGAALDVIEGERQGAIKRHPLVKFSRKNSNLLITPHMGGSSVESIEKTDLYVLNKFFNRQKLI